LTGALTGGAVTLQMSAVNGSIALQNNVSGTSSVTLTAAGTGSIISIPQYLLDIYTNI